MADNHSKRYPTPGTPEHKAYHAQKSREWYQRTKQFSPEKIKAREAYNRQRRAATKAEWVVKFGGVCAHCGKTFPDCVFEFHHVINSEKDTDPSKLFGRAPEVIATELARCIMLCANCHRIEHDRLKYADHSKRNLASKYSPQRGRSKPHRFGWRYRLGDLVFNSQAEAAGHFGLSPARISQLVSAPDSQWIRERCYKDRPATGLQAGHV